jgi:NAD(P)-dependent dehydrogenase (short-subunit alcohol dehydrogenase family)
MKGRVCIVTGATAGIGKATAHRLAELGATVVAIARDAHKGKATVAEIQARTGNRDVSLLLCDFSSQADVRRVAAEFREKHDALHVLVNNAGAVLGEHRITPDGLEATFATNHMGYFLLTTQLLDLLVASAPARVVSVASDAHQWGGLDLDDLRWERRRYVPMQAYGASKLANVLFAAELARRLAGKGVTSNSLHPGVIASNFGQSGPAWVRFGVSLLKPLLTTPEKGAATSLHLATSAEVEGITGKYWKNKKVVRASRTAQDEALARRLWEVSEQLAQKSAAASG